MHAARQPSHSRLQKSYDALMTEMLSLRQPLTPEYLPSAVSAPHAVPYPTMSLGFLFSSSSLSFADAAWV